MVKISILTGPATPPRAPELGHSSPKLILRTDRGREIVVAAVVVLRVA